MAINPQTQYPGKITPSSAAYPYGSARNITTPGDGTGTPWEAALVNDIFGFQQALLQQAGISPTGTPDAANASQYLDALGVVSGRKFTTVAAMVAADLKAGAIVATHEYDTGDGGEGGNVYLILSGTPGTPDGGSYINLSNGNQAQGLFPAGVNAKQFGAKFDDSTEDTTALENARDYADLITLPPGIARIEDLDFGSGKTWIGAGRGVTELKLKSGSLVNLTNSSTPSDTKIQSMTLNATGGAAGTRCMYASTPVRFKVVDVEIKNAVGVGAQFDQASYCEFDHIFLNNNGDFGLYLSTSGVRNDVSNVLSLNGTTRAVVGFGQSGSTFNRIAHDGDNGEVLYLESSVLCSGSLFLVQNTNAGLSDGFALGGGCQFNTFSGIVAVDCAGHAVSINGQTALAGASDNNISGVVALRPNEGGVIISDQAVATSIPARNIITRANVYNCGQSVGTEAFGVSGGVDNQFNDCDAHDTGPSTMTYGFAEVNGANTAARNSFKGRISQGTSGYYSIVASDTRLDLPPCHLVGVDVGDANATFNAGVDEGTQRYQTTLTANRTVTLGTGWNGAEIHLVREDSGAFTLDFGGLKTLPAATPAWAIAKHNGTAWFLAAYGTL